MSQYPIITVVGSWHSRHSHFLLDGDAAHGEGEGGEELPERDGARLLDVEDGHRPRHHPLQVI